MAYLVIQFARVRYIRIGCIYHLESTPEPMQRHLLAERGVGASRVKCLPGNSISMYQLELVWNREFDWVCYGNANPDITKVIHLAQTMEEMGDGEYVKKTRIVDENGTVVWQYGSLVKPR